MFHQRNFYQGLMAEKSVALKYQACGFEVLQERYRSSAGEIDIIAKHDQKLYFIEVKSAKTHDIAAERICARQVQRIRNAALVYLAATDRSLNTDMRFDAALVDRLGHIKVLPNAY